MERKHYYTGLILKQLSGKIQLSEKKELDAWLTTSEDHQQLFNAIRANWHSSSQDTQRSETAYQQLAQRLNLPAETLSSAPQPLAHKPGKIFTPWLKIAASLTGLLVLAGIAFYLISSPDNVVYQTGYGETATFVLPDNSEVTLNANSTLKLTSSWDKKTAREVWLDGEAFFQVQKVHRKQASQLPVKFVVHTEQVDVEVLGTQFNVNERRGKTAVVLNEGKVQLNSNVSQGEALVMEPGEYVEFSANQKQFVKKVVDPVKYSSWTENKLILDNTPLREIAWIIKDYYGLKVEIESDALAKMALTGSIPTNDLNGFLTVLSASLNVHIQQKENTLFISEKEAP